MSNQTSATLASYKGLIKRILRNLASLVAQTKRFVSKEAGNDLKVGSADKINLKKVSLLSQGKKSSFEFSQPRRDLDVL